MSKKGFTLVELLAVIVILAVISLIATPMILGVIETAKKKAAESSALEYIDAVEKQIILNQVNDSYQLFKDGVYDDFFVLKNIYGVNVKGIIPTDGWLYIIDNEIVDYSFEINHYIITQNEEVILDGEVKKQPWFHKDVDSNGLVTIGDELCYSSECFYVYNIEEDNYRLLAKYNLKVGADIIDSSTAVKHLETEERYNLQDPTMLGRIGSTYPRNGTIAFSTDSQHGTAITDYSGSLAEQIINSYVSILTSKGASIIDSRTMTKEELDVLVGFIIVNNSDLTSQYSDWLCSTAYHLNALSETRLWMMHDCKMYFGSPTIGNEFGIRPVIIISKAEIQS